MKRQIKIKWVLIIIWCMRMQRIWFTKIYPINLIFNRCDFDFQNLRNLIPQNLSPIKTFFPIKYVNGIRMQCCTLYPVHFKLYLNIFLLLLKAQKGKRSSPHETISSYFKNLIKTNYIISNLILYYIFVSVNFINPLHKYIKLHIIIIFPMLN